MRLNALHGFLMGGVLLLTPMALMAQDPAMPTNSPGSPSSSSGQVSTPGVKTSNASVFGQDSSTNSTGAPDTATLRDKVFLHEVGEGAVAEAQLGKLASTQASNDEIKKFGQTLVDDHTSMTDMIKPMAATLGVSVPTKMDKADQAEYQKLKGLTGPDFDKEFLLYFVTEHRKDLKEYRDEVIATSDTDILDAALSSAKMVLAHARTAVALAKANGVALPPMGPPPAGAPKPHQP